MFITIIDLREEMKGYMVHRSKESKSYKTVYNIEYQQRHDEKKFENKFSTLSLTTKLSQLTGILFYLSIVCI